jgi:hypothetical protein
MGGLINVQAEVQTMKMTNHPNVLKCFCSFVHKDQLWLVTQLMNKGAHLAESAAGVGSLRVAHGTPLVICRLVSARDELAQEEGHGRRTQGEAIECSTITHSHEYLQGADPLNLCRRSLSP